MCRRPRCGWWRWRRSPAPAAARVLAERSRDERGDSRCVPISCRWGSTIGLFLLLRPERTWQQRLRTAATTRSRSRAGLRDRRDDAERLLRIAVGLGVWLARGALRTGVTSRRTLGRYLGMAWSTHTPAIALALLAPWLLPGGLTALCARDVPREPRALRAVRRLRRLVVSALPAADDPAAADSRRRGHATRLLRRLRVPGVDWVTRGGRGRAVAAVRARGARAADVRPAGSSKRASSGPASSSASGCRRTRSSSPARRAAASASTPAGRRCSGTGSIRPGSIARSCYVRARGYEPYLLFERREEPDFRQRFAGSALARLDWPPMAEVASQVRIYRPDDRDRYLQGTLPPTEYVP